MKNSIYDKIETKKNLKDSNSSINDRKSKVRRFFYDRFVSRDLTKTQYLDLLFLIGENEGLYPTQIADRFLSKSRKSSKYVFELLQDLDPTKTMKMHLIVWEDFTSKSGDKLLEVSRKLYNLVNNIFEFGANITLGEKDNIELSTPTSDKIIITYGRHRLSIARLGKMAILEIFEENDLHDYKILYQIDLSIKNIKLSYSPIVKSAVYIECTFIVPLYYYIKTKEVLGRKLYFLNGLGFLLLLTSKEHGDMIKNIISKSSILDEIPFLKYWNIFNDLGFNVVTELSKIGEQYEHQIIKCENYNLLLCRIIESYWTGLAAHFGSMQFIKILQDPTIRVKYQKMWNDKILVSFIKQMFEQQKILLQKEIERISNNDPKLIKIYFGLDPKWVANVHTLSEMQ